MSEIDKRDRGVKSEENQTFKMRGRRTENSNVSFLSVARTRMDGFVGRGRGGEEERSARPWERQGIAVLQIAYMWRSRWEWRRPFGKASGDVCSGSSCRRSTTIESTIRPT